MGAPLAESEREYAFGADDVWAVIADFGNVLRPYEPEIPG